MLATEQHPLDRRTLTPMLSDAELVAFIPTTDLSAAKEFYESVLGLGVVEANDFAVVFDANGTRLRVTRVDKLHTAPFTSSAGELKTSPSNLPRSGQLACLRRAMRAFSRTRTVCGSHRAEVESFGSPIPTATRSRSSRDQQSSSCLHERLEGKPPQRLRVASTVEQLLRRPPA